MTVPKAYGSGGAEDLGLLAPLFAGSYNSLAALDPEAQLQDILSHIPSASNLGLISIESSPQALLPGPAAPAGEAVAETAGGELGPAAGPRVPRVASLDFVRAFLTAKQGSDAAAAAAPALPLPLGAAQGLAGLPALPPLAIIREEAACSSATALPGLPLGSLPPTPLSYDATTLGMPPPAVLAAFMHGGLASFSCLAGMGPQGSGPVPQPAVPAPMVPTLRIEPAELAGPAPSPPPTSTAAAGSDSRTLASHRGGAGLGSTGGSGSGSAGTSAKPKGAGAGWAAGPAGPAANQMSKAELRRARRMLSNRESARRSRKRKQEQLGELEGRIAEAQAHLADAQTKLARLSAELAQRDQTIAALRQQLKAAASDSGTGMQSMQQ